MQQIPLVAIRCITYNHESYIRDALDGFVMQQTNFPFVAIVHDDVSTDGTAAIIKEYTKRYPDIIKPIYEAENQYSKQDGSIDRIMQDACEATGAKYIAFCEGDDYWTDPYKLQKQVDFLETHPDYGLCYTSFNIQNETSGKFTEDAFKTLPELFQKTITSPEYFILHPGYVGPPTWMMRSDLYPKYRINGCDGTFVLFVHYLFVSKVHCIDDVTATYRIIEESASHSKNYEKMYQREQGLLKLQFELIDIYGFDKDLKDECIQNYWIGKLPDFIIHHQDTEIEKAREIIRNKTFREKLLFLLNDCHLDFVISLKRKFRKDWY